MEAWEEKGKPSTQVSCKTNHKEENICQEKPAQNQKHLKDPEIKVLGENSKKQDDQTLEMNPSSGLPQWDEPSHKTSKLGQLTFCGLLKKSMHSSHDPQSKLRSNSLSLVKDCPVTVQPQPLVMPSLMLVSPAVSEGPFRRDEISSPPGSTAALSPLLKMPVQSDSSLRQPPQGTAFALPMSEGGLASEPSLQSLPVVTEERVDEQVKERVEEVVTQDIETQDSAQVLPLPATTESSTVQVNLVSQVQNISSDVQNSRVSKHSSWKARINSEENDGESSNEEDDKDIEDPIDDDIKDPDYVQADDSECDTDSNQSEADAKPEAEAKPKESDQSEADAEPAADFKPESNQTESDAEPESYPSEVEVGENVASSSGSLLHNASVQLDENVVIADSEESIDSVVLPLQWKGPPISSKRSPKKNSCLHCGGQYQKLARHLQAVHNKEPDVAKVLMYKKNSVQRKQGFQNLINLGNFAFNCNAYQSGKELIPKYRSNVKEKQKKVPCAACKGLYYSGTLWKHAKRCHGGKTPKPVREGLLLLPSACNNEKFTQDVIIRMKTDAVTDVVKTDRIILEFGQRIYEKLGAGHHSYISQKMRELGHFLVAMRQCLEKPKAALQDVLTPHHFDTVLTVARNLGGATASGDAYTKPSVPVKLGINLNKCSSIIKNKAIREQDEQKKSEANDFLELMREWHDRISGPALSCADELKYNKPSRLPLTNDVVKLMKHIEKRTDELKSDIENYTEYAQLILAWVIIYNRKRSGETEKIKLKDLDYIIESQQVSEDVGDALSKFERELCRCTYRLETRGKRGRKVAVLFTKDMRDHIFSMVKMRGFLAIDSPFLFARNPSTPDSTPLRGCDALRQCALAAECEQPHLLRSTKLRKQLATLVQVLNLRENEMDLLASFLGHNINVHRKFYRLSEDTLQAAKISKLLHACNTGTISKYKNMNFDDIEVADEMEEETPEDDEVDEVDEVDDVDDEDDNGVDENSDEDVNDDTGTKPCEKVPMAKKKGKVNKKKEGMTRKKEHMKKNKEETKNSVHQNARHRRKKTHRTWSSEEKKAANSLIPTLKKGLPGKFAIEEVQKKYPVLQQRSWRQIKDYLRNNRAKLVQD